jgi:hypothetical protein
LFAKFDLHYFVRAYLSLCAVQKEIASFESEKSAAAVDDLL